MDGAEPGSGEHGDQGLGDHRHVDDHPVSFAYPGIPERTGKLLHFGEQAPVAVAPLGIQHRGVVDQRRGFPAAGSHVPVQRVMAGVQHSVRKPSGHWRGGGINALLRRNLPVDGCGSVQPEGTGVAQTLVVAFLVSRLAHLPLSIAGGR